LPPPSPDPLLTSSPDLAPAPTEPIPASACAFGIPPSDWPRARGGLESEELKRLKALPIPQTQAELDAQTVELRQPAMIREDKTAAFIAELPRAQYLAMIRLGENRGITEVAECVGVSRGTIYNWLRKDPRFIAALNKWRDINRHDVVLGWNAMTTRALRVLDHALADNNARIALAVLDRVVAGRPGPTDPKVAAELLKAQRVGDIPDQPLSLPAPSEESGGE
jgi:DNA-binding phage protein